MYPAYKISVKCSQNLTEQGSGCILLQDDKKNDVGNYFLISGWNSFTSLAISPLNRSMQIRFGIAISALVISEKFHTRAPGPPETMAVATPTIFPVPMVVASAVVSAEKGDTSPCPRLLVPGFLAECAFQCIAKVTPCKKSGAHSQEDTGSDQQDQHHRSPDKVINSGNNFFIKYFEDLQS